MFKRKEKAFTLIELIATLVIMAIIALIATPLVMNIIRKARISADKRSVDAYGRSIELAIAGYLLDNGKFPTEVSQLTIEYSGNKVECETTQINTDSSIYLAGCTVAGRSVENYTYDSVGTAYDKNGYGGMAYYSSETCGLVNKTWVKTGCKIDYASSEIKYVVDAWKAAKAPAATEVRLLTYEEASEYAEAKQICTGSCYEAIVLKNDWMYNNNYRYWTMSSWNDSSSDVWSVDSSGELGHVSVFGNTAVVRPVIIISKSVLSA